jgi:beta-lactam-binding protein with PASTA domain
MPTMPNLIGLQYQNALAAMVAAGVRVIPLGYFQVDPVTTSWLKAGSQPGYVLAQSVASGQSITPNAPILITVASYPMSVAGDTPVEPSPDATGFVDDGSGTPFVLDESTLK